MKQLYLLLALLVCASNSLAEDKVVYPEWFKQSLYDLPGDLQDARKAGKQGIMIFVSMETCSYCKAIIETTFQQADIVKRLRAAYDVLGLEVFSDIEVIDMQGKAHRAKNFAVHAKAQFTPTLLFYGPDGKQQLRLVGYQSPEKFRSVLDYLEQGADARMSLSEFMRQGKPAASAPSAAAATALNLDRRAAKGKPLLVVFESADCAKCGQLRTMLKAPMMQPYLQRLELVYLNSADATTRLTTPDGKAQSTQAWVKQLGLIHSPAMVFFDANGKEAVRVDTDILLDQHGRNVSDNDPDVLDNVRARLQFFLDKGYVTLPQFQRWRAQQMRQ